MKFNEIKSVHIIGVCGTLMGAFAAYLKRSGIAVTGSDQNVYPPMSDVLKDAGVRLFSGYAAENLLSLPFSTTTKVLKPKSLAPRQISKALCEPTMAIV